MSAKFYNPYQFVSVEPVKPENTTNFSNLEALKKSTNCFVRHDFWHKEGLSGRIHCTLETKSPMVVGAKQIPCPEKKNPSIIEPYRDTQGEVAIPANSLRGMFGSIAETISQSALRVLVSGEKGSYSVRKPAKAKDAKPHEKPLKMLGIIFQTDNGFELYPLIDDEQKKAYTIGDYAEGKKNKKGKASSRDWRKENNIIKDHSCFQYEDNPVFDTYRGKQGIYYIRGRFPQMPNKQHELFISWDGNINQTCLSVDADVVNTFNTILHTLAEAAKGDESTIRSLLPKGYATEERLKAFATKSKTEPKPSIVKSGDVVYFRQERGEVVEISYSSIWRRAIEGDLHHSFEKHVEENSIPWHAGRTHLTPAEALFGVVEDQPNKARNLASRVRFSDATSEHPIKLEPAITLKILNSPKPPSPAMYFSANHGYLSKSDLDLTKHKPNGRKQYISHRKVVLDKEHHWKTNNEENNHMKVSCNPIPSGKTFSFDVFFENLSQAELSLLHMALQPSQLNPDKPFLHRLGLGKPLGLGHIELTQADITFIDRSTRYSVANLKQPRETDNTTSIEMDQSLIDESALAQLIHLSSPNELEDIPVCYPYDHRKKPEQNPYHEEKGFQWFEANDQVGSGRNDYLHRSNNTLTQPMKPLKSE